MSGDTIPKHGMHRTMGSDKSDDFSRFLDNIFDLESAGPGGTDTVMAGSCPTMADELFESLDLPTVQLGEPSVGEPILQDDSVKKQHPAAPLGGNNMDESMSDFVYEGAYHHPVKPRLLEPLCVESYPGFDAPKPVQTGFGQSPSSCRSAATPLGFPSASDSEYVPNLDMSAVATCVGADSVSLKRSRVSSVQDSSLVLKSPKGTALTPREREVGLATAPDIVDLTGVEASDTANIYMQSHNTQFSPYLPSGVPTAGVMDVQNMTSADAHLHMTDFTSAMESDDVPMHIDDGMGGIGIPDALPMKTSALHAMDAINNPPMSNNPPVGDSTMSNNPTITTGEARPVTRMATPPPGHFASVVTGLSTAPSPPTNSPYLPVPAANARVIQPITHVASSPNIVGVATPRSASPVLPSFNTSALPPQYQATFPSPRLPHSSPRDAAFHPSVLSQAGVTMTSPPAGTMPTHSPASAPSLCAINTPHSALPTVSSNVVNTAQLAPTSLLGLQMQHVREREILQHARTPSPRTLMPPPPPVPQPQSSILLDVPTTSNASNGSVFSPVHPTPSGHAASPLTGPGNSAPLYHQGLPHLPPIRGGVPVRAQLQGSVGASPYPGTPASYPNTPTTNRAAAEFAAQQLMAGHGAPAAVDADLSTAALPSPSNKQTVIAEMKELLMVMDRLETQQRQLAEEMQALECKDGVMDVQGPAGSAFGVMTPVSSDLKQTINQVEQTNGALRQEMDSLLQQVAALS